MEIDLNNMLGWVLPLLGVVAVVALGNWLLNRAFENQPRNKLYRQLAKIGVAVFAQIGLVLLLPLDNETRGQLLSLFGLVLTAVIALSSTTLVSNAMAGVTLKVIGSFHTGDFIQVGDYFGRVRNKTLLHTEIQSEDRDAITLPNMFIINNPVKVVDQSGTLISAEVSIGYDVHREKVRAAMLRAAEQAQLAEPFTQIIALGNFAIEYKVTGMLADVSTLVSKRTELRAHLIDQLHAASIEIMTPNVMHQRALEGAQIPVPEAVPAPEFDSGKAESIMFDKADLAARMQKIRAHCEALRDEIKKLESEDAADHKMDISWLKHQLSAQESFLAQIESEEQEKAPPA